MSQSPAPALSVAWDEVAATAGIALAVLAAALCVPIVRDWIRARGQRPHTGA